MQAAVRSARSENVFTPYKTTSVAERKNFQGKAAFETGASRVTMNALFLRVPETHAPTLQIGGHRVRPRQENLELQVRLITEGRPSYMRFQAIRSDSMRFRSMETHRYAPSKFRSLYNQINYCFFQARAPPATSACRVSQREKRHWIAILRASTRLEITMYCSTYGPQPRCEFVPGTGRYSEIGKSFLESPAGLEGGTSPFGGRSSENRPHMSLQKW